MASLGWGTWWHRRVCLAGWLSCDTWPLSSHHTCSFSPKTAKTWDQTKWSCQPDCMSYFFMQKMCYTNPQRFLWRHGTAGTFLLPTPNDPFYLAAVTCGLPPWRLNGSPEISFLRTVFNYIFLENIWELGSHSSEEHRNQTKPEPRPTLYELSGPGQVIWLLEPSESSSVKWG